MRGGRFVALVLALVLMVLAGCGQKSNTGGGKPSSQGPSANTGQAGANNKSIIVGIGNDPSGWDLDFTTNDEIGLSMGVNVDPYLFEYGTRQEGEYAVVDTTKLLGLYAESYQVSPDGKTWTITLRKDAQFPDGTPVDAEALKWSKDRGLAVQANVGFVFRTIGINSPEHVKVLDSHTLQLTMDHYSSLTPYMLQIGTFFDNPKLLKEHAASGDEWATAWHAKNPGHGGPYTVANHVQGQRIVLQKNPHWPGQVKNDEVILQIIPSEANRMLTLKRGDVDIAFGLSRKDVQELKSDANLKVLSIPSINQVYLTLNHGMAPFDNPKVREAVAHAIPYQDIIEKIYFGDAVQAKSVLPKGMPGYVETHWKYDLNLEKAKQLLVEAGYPDGLETTLTIQSDVREHELLALLIQGQLAQVGIHLKIQKLDTTTLQEQRAKRTLEFQLQEGVMWVNDPEYLFNAIFVPDGYLNHADYNNPRVTEIVKESAQIVDFEERIARYDEAQKLVLEDLPWIPIAQPNYVIAMRKNLEGFLYGDDMLMRLWTLYKN